MGNYKFRLSDMIPNAWFYKLNDMNKFRKQQQHKDKATKEKHSSSTFSSSSSLSLSASSIATQPTHSSKFSDQSHVSDQRKSYYFTRDLNNNSQPNSPGKIRTLDKQEEPPRKSSRRRRRSTKRSRNPNRLVTSMASAGCSCRTTLESVWTKLPAEDSTPEEYPESPIDKSSSSDHDSLLPEYGSDRGLTPDTFDSMVSWSTSCRCRIENDSVIDMDNEKPSLSVSPLDHLPPIISKKTEPTKTQRTSAEFSEKDVYGSLSVKVEFLDDGAANRNNRDQPKIALTSPVRRSWVHSSSPGVKLRTNSPRIANRRIQGRKSLSSNSSSVWRRSVTESFAVVKSSKDPRRDFRESMVEMIVENNIRGSKDLEELLACYLSLNSDEYHDLIINVFKQIWFDFIHLRFN